MTGELVFLELGPRDARNAKIAISKTNRENYGRGDEGYSEGAVERVVEELDKGYDEVREFFNTDYVPEDSGFETLGDFA